MPHSPFKRPFWSRQPSDPVAADDPPNTSRATDALDRPPTSQPLRQSEPVRRSAPVERASPDKAAEEYLSTKQAARFCGGLSPRTLERMRITGDGPVYIKVGGGQRKRGRVLYRRSDLIAWLEGTMYGSTSEYARSK